MTTTQVSQLYNEFKPKITVDWERGYDEIDFLKPLIYFIVGTRDSGKSALLEWIATKILTLSESSVVFDFYGSKDCESVVWCRSPWKDKVLLIHGDSVRLSCDYDTLSISQLNFESIKTFQKYRVVLTTPRFYSRKDPGEKYLALSKLSRILEWRGHWKTPWFVMLREAANFINSRMYTAKNQYAAKADFAEIIRESRHTGLSFGIDALKPTSIEIDVRSLADYIFLKSLGIDGLEFYRTIRWIYGRVSPPSLTRFAPHKSLVISDNGAWGYCATNYVPWHKEEFEDILKVVGIEIKYDVVPDYGSESTNQLSDFAHADIVRLYGGDEGVTKTAVAHEVGRSEKTVRNHIKAHNNEIEKKGYCLRCKRVKSDYEFMQVRI